MRKRFFVLLLPFLLMICFSSTANADTGNDSFETAKLINTNTVNTGTLERYSDENDYYQFTLSQPGLVTIKMDNNSIDDWQFSILDINKNQVLMDITDRSLYASETRERSVGLSAGTFFIKIKAGFSCSGIPYRFKLDFLPDNNREMEPNNKMSQATPINLSTYINGEAQYNMYNVYEYEYPQSSDLDYYKVTIPDAGALKITMSQKSNLQWNVTVMNEQSKIYEKFTTDNSSAITLPKVATIGLPKGTYYILIDPESNAQFEQYTFKVDFNKSSSIEKEFNNTAPSANPINLGTTYSGSIQSYTDDIDYYTFNLSQAQYIKLQFSDKPFMSWAINIYDLTGNLKKRFITSGSQFAVGVQTFQVPLSKGKYYMSVEYNSDAIDKTYNFTIKSQTLPAKSSSVKINNYVGKPDVIQVNSLVKGDQVKVYSSKGALLAAARPITSTSAKVTIKQLGSKAGSIYVTITRSKMLESPKVKIGFKAEPVTPSISTKNITIKNNKGKADTIGIINLKKRDVVKVYSSKGKLLTSTRPITSSKALLRIKQVGLKSGYLYITVTRSGMHESTKIKKSFASEKK